MNKCKFCEKSFSTKSNLSNHQKTAKYCLDKQKKSIINEYKCFCEKIFTTKLNFERHDKICNIKKEKNIKYENILYIQKLESENKLYLEQLEKKDIHIKQLEDKLADIALAGVNKSTTVNNNISNINNKILNISPLHLNDSVKIKNILDTKFDHNYIIDGQKGVAQFLVDHYLKDDDGKLKYVCTDPSRQIFKYKDDLGDIQKDVKAKKLTKTIIDGGLKEKNHNISESWWTEDCGKTNSNRFTVLQPKTSEISNLSISENTLFANELSAITTI